VPIIERFAVQYYYIMSLRRAKIVYLFYRLTDDSETHARRTPQVKHSYHRTYGSLLIEIRYTCVNKCTRNWVVAIRKRHACVHAILL